LAQRGDLDVDPEMDSSGTQFVTCTSIKRHWIAHHETKRRTAQPVVAVPRQERPRASAQCRDQHFCGK
jgi:hypothetical protein